MSLIKVRITAKAADAGNFKVGDLVRMNEGGLTGKITKIEPNGHFRVSFLYNRANGFSQSFSANEIVMVKPAKDAAADSAAKDAQDANGDEVIAQKNGCKLVHNTLNDGYWFYTKSGAGWGITATNKVAAVNEFNRLVATANDSAADASEVQRVEKLLKRELTDAEFWKLGDYVMKHMKVGKIFTDNELLSAVKDCASVDSNADSAQDAYIAFPTPPANGKPFPQEARIIEKLKKEMMDFASHVEDAAHHFDFVANVNKRGNTLEEQELYDFYRAWEHKCDSIRAALH